MSRITNLHNSVPSILSSSEVQQAKKKKRISFSSNMVFQEVFEDGTTRTYLEKVEKYEEPCSVNMTIEDNSDNILNVTCYDVVGMENSAIASSPCPPVGSPTGSKLESPVDSSLASTELAVNSPKPSPVCSPDQTSEGLQSVSPAHSLIASPLVSTELPQVNSPKQSPVCSPKQTSEGLQSVSPAHSVIASPLVSTELPQVDSPKPSPGCSPDQTSIGSPEPDSFSFESDALEQSRRDYSTCFSMIESQAETMHHDSILVYVEQKSILELSSEEEISPVKTKSICTEYNTTYIGSLFNDSSMMESDPKSDDDVFNFIDNSIFTKLPENLVDLSSIDPKLHKFIIVVNNESAILRFFNGNFHIHLQFTITDVDKTEVSLQDISIECLIDKKIEEKGATPLSEYSVHLLRKPRDEKMLKLIKKTVATRFGQFKLEKETTTTTLSNIIKDLRKMFYPIEALFVDLFNVCIFHEWKIINANLRNFEIAFEIFGLRYSLWLVLCFDLLGYPTNNIKVKFAVHKADLKLYPYHLFHKVMRSVSCGSNDYLNQMIKTAKKFILDWRSNHEKKSIRLSIHPSRKTMGDQTLKRSTKHLTLN